MTASLPDWLDPLLGAEQMRATDRWAIEERRIPSRDLMERAGAGLALHTDRTVPRGGVAVVCGKGNNGGDGFVAARILRELGRRVRVLRLAEPDDYRGDAREALRRLGGAHEPFESSDTLENMSVIVDAIFGTGFSGEPRGPARAAIEAIMARGVTVVSADIASGVDASTGEAAGACITATTTATFAAAKAGHWIAPGKQHTGVLHVVDIGIPSGAPVTPDVGRITPRVHELVPRRDASSTKFSSGHVIVAGGSRGLTGAPCLAAQAAMRAGAGYVTVLVAGAIQPVVEARLLEVMTRGMPSEDGALIPAAVEHALAALERGRALVLGPGAGRSEGAVGFMRELAARAPVPLLLDADGLNAHAGMPDALAARDARTVLTPHAGELARLLGTTSDDVQAHRLHSAREAARRARAVVVLKGDDTIVALPDGRAAVNDLSAPALATAGTGDVLSGVIGALLAKGMEPFAAACAGVRRHAAAGRVAAARYGADSVIASDVVAALAHALEGEEQDAE